MLIYDPPSGWKYGFPKAYLPKPSESMEDTLRRDGYPEKEIQLWVSDGRHIPVRFWEHEGD